MIISAIRLDRLRLPLRIPYKLAFGPVTAFDTVLVRVTGDGGDQGFGEATILTGYTDETIDGCWRGTNQLAKRMVGENAEAAMDIALDRHADMPFTVTALVTAVEMAAGSPLLVVDAETPVPLLAALTADTESAIPAELQRHADAGYAIVKVKAGFDIDADLARVAHIQKHLPAGISIRVDGNQGYTAEDGERFAASLDPAGIELLEQPCHMDDWGAAVAVARTASVPVMLDESIYGLAEIERAADLKAAQFIKLKLMKAGGLTRLADQLARIHDLGMTPVLGNGVATDVGCWMEACVARGRIDNAGEMNGFLRPVTSILAHPMRLDRGSVILATTAPALDDNAITAHATDTAHHGQAT